MGKSKKHHFVPQLILRNFTEHGKDLLHIYDKSLEKTYASTVANTGHENNFNSIKVGEDEFNFEDIFGPFEAAAAPIIKRLITTEQQFELSPEEAYTLSLFVLVQQIRTKLARTTIQQMSRDILDWIKSDGHDLSIPFTPISDDQSKIFALAGFDDMEDRVKLLLERGIILHRAPSNKPFWISDNPVIMYNHYPYGRTGLGTPGTDIFMPLSKFIGIEFKCKLFCDKVVTVRELMDKNGHPIDDEVQRYYAAIKHNQILELSPDNVIYYNHLQVKLSSRFLYSSVSDFALAKDMISETPELKELKTTMGVGNERKYPGMPPGEHAVFYFPDDHFMIPVELILDDGSGDLVFTTSTKPLNLYDFWQRKVMISSIEVFKDQVMIRLMREVLIHSVEVIGKSVKVAIKHDNEAISQWLEQRRNRKKKQ